MKTPTKSGVRALAVLALAALSLLAGAAQASARTVPVYTYTGQYYDGAGSTAGTLAYPSDLDLNQTAEKGYLTDPARLGGSVSQFDGVGNPLAFSALEGATAVPLHLEAAEHVAVDNSSTSSHGNIYALAENVVKGFRPDGTELGGGFPLGGFQKTCDIAVDAEGDLWVVNYSSSKMLEYNALGESTGRSISYKPFTTGVYNGACSLSFDSEDNIYFVTFGYLNGVENDYGRKLDSEGHVLSSFGGSAVTTSNLTTDMTTNHVFTLESKPYEGGFAPMVIEYDENGEAITSFGTPDPAHSFEGLEGPTGVAVAAGDQRVYVANQRDYGGTKHIDIFEKTGQADGSHGQDRTPGADADEGDARWNRRPRRRRQHDGMLFPVGVLRELRSGSAVQSGKPDIGRGGARGDRRTGRADPGSPVPLPAGREKRQRDPRLRPRSPVPAAG